MKDEKTLGAIATMEFIHEYVRNQHETGSTIYASDDTRGVLFGNKETCKIMEAYSAQQVVEAITERDKEIISELKSELKNLKKVWDQQEYREKTLIAFKMDGIRVAINLIKEESSK